MRRAVLLLALLAACGPAAPADAPRLLGGEPAAQVALPEAVAPQVAAGAVALEDAEAAAPTTGVAESPGAPAAVGAPPATLPTWLRPVRDVPPPSVIGTGRSSPKHVGLQVGHLANEDLPAELERLRASGGGATGGGYSEVQVNYDLAIRTAALLRERGVEVDVLPATVPVDYQADAFVAIHADGDVRAVLRGFKVASSPMSQIPTWDEALVGWLNAEYARATGLPRDDAHISRRMLFYYAFNNRRYYHAIAPGTPAAIAETGFMTSATDRALLIGTPERAAAGLAAGILGFLGVSQ